MTTIHDDIPLPLHAKTFISNYTGTTVDNIPNDAVYQLLDAFMPAIRIMVDRSNLRGELWQQSGWRGALYEARKKMERLWRSWWLGDQTDDDSALDLLNFTGFFIRAATDKYEEPWGMYGAPGSTRQHPE